MKKLLILSTVGIVAIVVGVGVLLTWAIKHDAKVEAEWKAKCVESGLPPQQCEILWSVKYSSDAAVGLAAGAMGASIANSVRR